MDIMDRMIEWLHAQPDPKGRTFHPLHPETLMVEALFEIERLQRALDYYAERTPSPYAGTGPYDPETLMVEALIEIEKLREALHRIQHSPNGPKIYCRDGHEEAVLIARAALGEDK